MSQISPLKKSQKTVVLKKRTGFTINTVTLFRIVLKHCIHILRMYIRVIDVFDYANVGNVDIVFL